MKYTVIDIGSNSIRMIIANCWSGGFKVIVKDRVVVKLADELQSTGKIGKRAFAMAQDVLKRFTAISKEHDVLKIYAFGTSAVRDAKNQQEFLQMCQTECGILVDVLDGEKEAQMSFSGALGSKGTGTLIDVGGGSTEVLCAVDGKIMLSASAPIGCVRAYEMFHKDANPFSSTRTYVRELEIPCTIAGKYYPKRSFEKILAAAKKYGGKLHAVGGSATTLCAYTMGMTTKYDSDAINDRTLNDGEILKAISEIARMSIDHRKQIPILQDRADTILVGAAIIWECMRGLQSFSITASDADNLEGYLTSVILGW